MSSTNSAATATNVSTSFTMKELEASAKKLATQYRYHKAHNAGNAVRNKSKIQVAGVWLIIYEARDTKIIDRDVWSLKRRVARAGEDISELPIANIK